MKRPVISVIISTYNSEKFIAGRLDNLIDQSIFSDIEIIIVNSGSQQNEEEVIRKYLQEFANIKYIKTEIRETIYKAWNRGVKLATGEFITNGNTDDRLTNEALETLSDYLKNHPEVALVYANQYIVNSADEYQNIKNITGRYIRPEYSRLQLCYQYFAGSQSMWKSSLHFNENIWFDENYEVAGDYDFISKVALKYEIGHIDKYLGYYYISPNQSNKEFQNIQRTVNETIMIQLSYTQEYINSLKLIERRKLLKRLMFFHILPRKVYSLIKKMSEKVIHKKIVPTRIYLTYLISVILEAEGELEKALKICIEYEDYEHAHILHRQIHRLKKEEFN